MNKFYIFDLDGTLTDAFKGMELRPHVRDWFMRNKPAHVAICTNRGGVGLRHLRKELIDRVDIANKKIH